MNKASGQSQALKKMMTTYWCDDKDTKTKRYDFHAWCVDKDTGKVIDKDFPDIYKAQVSLEKITSYKLAYLEWNEETLPEEIVNMIERQKDKIEEALEIHNMNVLPPPEDMTPEDFFEEITKLLDCGEFGFCLHRAYLRCLLCPEKYELKIGNIGITPVKKTKKSVVRRTKKRVKKPFTYWIIGNGMADYNDTTYLDTMYERVVKDLKKQMMAKIGRLDEEYLAKHKYDFYHKGRC